MSCVVGIKHNGKIYMGADGVASTDDGDIRPIICKKIFKNGPYLIGFCGSVRSGQLLTDHYFEPPKNILDFPNEIRNHYIENGALLPAEENATDRCGVNILIAKEDRLYEILVDFQLSEIEKFTAIGSGSTYAFGALEILNYMDSDPKDSIMMALSAASKFCTSVGPPFEIDST